MLKNDPNAALLRWVVDTSCAVVQYLVSKADTAIIGLEQASQKQHQGRLTAARRTKNAHLGATDLEIGLEGKRPKPLSYLAAQIHV